METKAEAHSTTVVPAAAIARRSRTAGPVAGAAEAGMGVVMSPTLNGERFGPHRMFSGSTPSSSCSARSPSPVAFTARPDPILTHQPASRACLHNAAPAAPAR